MFPMVSFVSWNIRGIGSNGSLEILLLFQQQFHFPVLCLQGPMVACDKMDKFRRKLGFHQAYNNSSNKIWILWLNDIDDEVIHDWEQHVFLKVIHNVDQIFFPFSYLCQMDRAEEKPMGRIESYSKHYPRPLGSNRRL